LDGVWKLQDEIGESTSYSDEPDRVLNVPKVLFRNTVACACLAYHRSAAGFVLLVPMLPTMQRYQQ